MHHFRKVLSYAKEKRAYYLLSLFLSAISTIASFLPYYYFYRLLTTVSTHGYRDKDIHHIVWMILLWTLIYSIAYLFSLFCSHIFAFRIERNLKQEGLSRLLHSSFSFFDRNASGRVRKIIDDNTALTHMTIAHLIPDMVNAILFPLGMLILGFFINFYVGLMFIFEIVIAIVCFSFMYGRDNKNAMQQYLGANERLRVTLSNIYVGYKSSKYLTPS